jgi:hypothetical protein
MTSQIPPSQSGEPVLAWLERRTANERQATLEFDDLTYEYRRLVRVILGTDFGARNVGSSGALTVGADITLMSVRVTHQPSAVCAAPYPRSLADHR